MINSQREYKGHPARHGLGFTSSSSTSSSGSGGGKSKVCNLGRLDGAGGTRWLLAIQKKDRIGHMLSLEWGEKKSFFEECFYPFNLFFTYLLSQSHAYLSLADAMGTR